MKLDLINRIGVFYLDSDWCENAFRRVLESIPPDAIRIIKHERNHKIIQLKDGTFIRFVRANESSRGYKFDRIFYQYGIAVDVMEKLILPMWYSRKPSEFLF